jgi:hypothetical protein
LNWTLCAAWLSQLIGVSHLAILRFCSPRGPPIQLPTSPNEALNVNTSRSSPAHSRDPIHAHTPKVDLGIAKVSLALQVTFFAFIAISKDAVVFVTAGALGALAMGYPPTVQSLSLELYTRRGGAPSESGRLFGAMSVIQTIGYVVPTEVLCEVRCDHDTGLAEPEAPADADVPAILMDSE